MGLNTEKQGELYIALECLLWGLFPVITALSYNQQSPLIALEISTLFATGFFALVLSIKHKWYEVKNIAALKDILLGTFFIGVLYYFLYFFGLRYTSPGNASIIALTEVFFSFIFFHVWRKEYIPSQHIVGAVLMILGACIVLLPNVRTIQLGDILILVAAFVAPFGNYYQQKARIMVSSETILFIRSAISAAVIFIILFASGATVSTTDLKQSLIVLLINGTLMLGLSKLLWIEGIHRISVTKAVALESVSPIITLLFAWILLKNAPTIWQLTSFAPMFIGILFLGVKTRKIGG
jgi:drug/metabolite transporter (DMT)-like permease